MPKWIHDRARHIQAKNPGMQESTAFAIATQQSHKLGKTPKGYGTAEGKREARAKYDQPRKSYKATADPKGIGKELDAKLKKEKTAMDDNTYTLVYLQGFSDETQKIAAAGKIAGPAGQAGKRLLEVLRGSRLQKDVFKEIPTAVKAERGRLGKMFGMKPKVVEEVKKIPVGTKRVGVGEALKDKGLRGEALKTIGARGAAAGVAGAAAVGGAKRHKKKEQRRMGRAYVSGARDMYARMHGYG